MVYLGAVLGDLEHEEVADIEVWRRKDLNAPQVLANGVCSSLVDGLPFVQNDESI